MNEINTIADIYLNMNQSRCRLINENDEPDIDVFEPDPQLDVTSVNIFIRPENGAIFKPYNGDVINITELDGSTTLIAKDQTNNKTLQIISTASDEMSVTIMDDQGRVQDTFMGKNIDFYDTDEQGNELNIIKIENV